MGEQTTEPSPIPLLQEIERTDAIASSVFEVLMALGAAAVAVVFAVDVIVARIAAVVVGAVVSLTAIDVIPDVVLAHRQPDRGESSLRAYLKHRQRVTARGAVVIFVVATAGFAAGGGYVAGVVMDSPTTGGVVGVAGFIGGLGGLLASREDVWPREIRGKVRRPKR